MTQKDEGQDNEINSESMAPAPETPATEETPDARRVQLEKDACKKCDHGDLLGAIEDIDEAIAVDKRWYHYLFKAQWIAQLQDWERSYATLQTGLGHCRDKQFWFRYVYAWIVYNQPSSTNTIEEVQQRIKNLDNAIIEAEFAYKTIEADRINTVEGDITEIPTCFTDSGYMNLNVTNLKFMVSGLLRDLKLSKNALATLSAMYAAGTLLDSKFAEINNKVESERIKTIELLGIFTAIISFVIITGTSALKMDSFEIAMPILGGLALVLLALVSAVSLFTTRYTRSKDVFRDPRLWAFLFLVGAIIVLVCYSVGTTAEQNKPIFTMTSTKENVSMGYTVFNYIMVSCAIIGTGAIFIAASQLYLSCWLKAQEIFTDEKFREARGVVLSHYWQRNKAWTKDDEDKKTRELVCAKMDELARLRPFISWRKILKTWDDPMGKCWDVLQDFIIGEQRKTDWKVKWKAFDKLGKKAFAKVKARETRQPNT